MSDQIKRIDLKEFREGGYLQELNRQFFHPLGLALEMIVEDDGEHKLGGIWDYRHDPEGMNYGLSDSDDGRVERFRNNALKVSKELNDRIDARHKALGFVVEPIAKENGHHGDIDIP